MVKNDKFFISIGLAPNKCGEYYWSSKEIRPHVIRQDMFINKTPYKLSLEGECSTKNFCKNDNFFFVNQEQLPLVILNQINMENVS